MCKETFLSVQSASGIGFLNQIDFYVSATCTDQASMDFFDHDSVHSWHILNYIHWKIQLSPQLRGYFWKHRGEWPNLSNKRGMMFHIPSEDNETGLIALNIASDHFSHSPYQKIIFDKHFIRTYVLDKHFIHAYIYIWQIFHTFICFW